MKRMLLAAFSALCLGASAQITVTSATFPVAGDTLHYAIDNSPVGINPATAPGPNQTWIFTSLEKDDTENITFKNANTGFNSVNYPGAELVVFNAGEVYFNVTSTKFEVMGFSGGDPAGFGLSVNTHYMPNLTERRSPMNYIDNNNQVTNLSLSFPTDQPPLDSLFSGLPVNIDSLRVKVQTARQELIDAWGTCQIPGGQYPVLRKKRTDYVTTGIDVFVSLFPGFGQWVDLSTLVGGSGGLGDLIGTDTSINYIFYSGTEKEEIADVEMTPDLSEVVSVRYKNNQTSAVNNTNAPGTASISAFPNPAIDWVRFDYSNLPQDEYTLKIFNIIGKEIWKETYHLSGTHHFRVELDNFKKGTYLYSLTDKKGNVIGTKRLVVLKP